MQNKNLLADKLAFYTAYLYLTIPLIIFLAGWLKWYYGLASVIIVIVSLFRSLNAHDQFMPVNLIKHKKKIAVVLGLIFLWIFFSGIGAFVYQNDDHWLRNAILRDLINNDWPVVYDLTHNQSHNLLKPGNYMLVYYIGYWMPSALIGKVFGWQAANIFLFLWTMLGITLAFYFMCRYLKKISINQLLIFIFFSGMDVIPAIINGTYKPLAHMEAWMSYLQYSSDTTLLYWVFHQAIVPWLVVAMLMNNIPKENIFFLCLLVLFYGPFPFIGLLPFVIYFSFFNPPVPFIKSCRQLLSFQNIAGCSVIFFVLMGFYTSNYSEQNFNLSPTTFLQYITFVLVEFLILATVLLSVYKKNALLLTATISLMIFPFLQFRHTADFNMRASIPALFILMIFTAACLHKARQQSGQRSIIIILLIAGSFTSLHEIGRTVYLTAKFYYVTRFKKSKADIPLERDGTIFRNNNPLIKTVVGDTKNSFFYQHFCRKN